MIVQGIFAQGSPRIKLTQLEQSKVVESSRAGQIPLSNSAGDLRYAQYVEVDLVQIGFVPTPSGNTSHYSEFVIASDSSRWYIDWQGRGYQFPSGGSGPDKNGYYGGNLGNGGDQTIPSSTTSTITNQMTFYKPGTTNFNNLTPLRVVLDGGNESPIMAFVHAGDSMLVKRSDTEFSFRSRRGIFTQSDENIGLNALGIVNISGDSISIQTVPNAFAGERTFLTYSPNTFVTKKEGINLTDLNFDPYQTISASGSGTLFGIDLSDGGGSVFLREGANVDLTRSGDTITIAATGGGGGGQTLSASGNDIILSGGGGSVEIAGAGINVVSTLGNIITITGTEVDGSITNELQTLNNTSNATSHTATLSNSGGSVQLVEGTGIGLATTGTPLNGIATITNTAPDQTVTITNGGGITVSGTYPNFTLTAADQSATNEIQVLSATGAGPTAYNIELSLSGGFVTLTEGANIDLTRSGNNITIASTLAAQTFSNTSNATSHTVTLSGGGGSVQLVEGTGIGLATTGTPLNGIATITNTAPDQTVTITNGGGITVSGTYPNFTLTAADQSATNEIQTISASGAGPTAYNIELSLSGGFVTLTEGANIDLTRSGNNITIAATGGTQTFDNTSNATSHTVTLSGGGGSVQLVEGTGIGLATTGTPLNGIATITNTAPDQTVTITNGGGITVSGTYPNFTLTAADQSATNEIQVLSATGAGPTAFNIELSLSGGFVTLTEGANIDLTRSGNNITIASTLAARTFSNTSNATSHTVTLSGGGGSVQLVEGTGIGLATTGTPLNGIATITNTAPDQTVTITNGGGITVSGTYPNFTLTAADQSATNEIQTISATGAGPTAYNIELNLSGGSVTLTEGANIDLTRSGNNITIASTGGTLNGYYGGNGGNGGDNTIPSVTRSTLTNQLTFYRATDDSGGFSPLRVEVGGGNEPDFITCKYSTTDSCTWGRSDFEYLMQSSNGMVVQGETYVALIGDSVSLQDLAAPYGTGKRNFVVQMSNSYLKKQNGINAVDCNFTVPSQQINEYTSNATYAVPAGAKSIDVVLVGAGGGGGAGRKGAAGTNRFGGGGGAAGAVTVATFSIVELGNPANITVTVGVGGAGGALNTTNSTNGENGTAGETTEISISGSVITAAGGGGGGQGGTSANGFASGGQARGDFASSNAGAGASGSAASPAVSQNKCGGAGAGGAGRNTSNGVGTGGVGASGFHFLSAGGGAGSNGGGPGGNGAAPTLGRFTGGGGGGGGAGNAFAGNGGNGARGAGGGGGGGGENSLIDGGAGGSGGNGWVRIIANF